LDSNVEELTAHLHPLLKNELDLSRAICDRVQSRVARHVWQAFWLTAIENRTGLEAAERLGIKAATVFVYKARVIKMLRQEAAAVGQGGQVATNGISSMCSATSAGNHERPSFA
jgi:DNA-directed RNA polymerase specialized sigma24 family protein